MPADRQAGSPREAAEVLATAPTQSHGVGSPAGVDGMKPSPVKAAAAEAAQVADVLATPPTETDQRPNEPDQLPVESDQLPTESHELATRADEPPTENRVSPTETHARDGAPEPPRLADGIELIGEFADSGFKTAPFIARRSDGQVVQMPDLLFRLAEQIDGQAGPGEIAERFSHAIERKVETADAQMLIEEQLRPLGIVAPPAGTEAPELNKVDPLLSLKLRTAVVPDGVVRSLTTVFRPLFLPPVMVAVVLAMLGVDGWLFFVHGITQSLRHVLYQPALMLMLIGGVVLATAFHEIGHATACRYGGAKPGVMGVGIYIVWPAFYTDITDAYRLDKRGRLRTDIGGMYFNAVFALAMTALYFLTSFAPLLLLVVLGNFAIIQQALPLLRLDGYYILSDLTGVPDIFQRIRPVLTSFIPGRASDERVTALKSWVRIVVSAYVLMIVAFLGFTVLALVINLPRIVGTGYDSAALRFDTVGPAFRHGQTLKGILNIIQMLFLVLPGAGLAYTAVRVLRRTTTGAYRWSAGRPGRQVTIGLTGAAAIAVAAFSWWPNGEYRPIQPGERGTLTGLFHQVAALPSGRPSMTVERQQQLGGAPTERERMARPADQSHTTGASKSAPGIPQRSRSHSGPLPLPNKTSTTVSGTATTNSTGGAGTPPPAGGQTGTAQTGTTQSTPDATSTDQTGSTTAPATTDTETAPADQSPTTTAPGSTTTTAPPTTSSNAASATTTTER